MLEEKRAKQTESSQVYKQEDLDMMIELIESGIYSTKNLMTALHLCKDTIVRWKKRPEVQLAHRKAILKFSKKRKDPEGSLKELGIEAARVEEKSHIEVTIRGYED